MFKSFSSEFLGFHNRTLADDIPLAVKYGYEGINIEIKKEAATYSPPEFNELLANNSLKSGGFVLPVEFRKSREIFEEDFRELRSYCKFAKKTGNTRCMTNIIPYSDTLDFNSNFRLHKERLTSVAKTLEEYGIRFGLEFIGPAERRRGKAHGFIYNLDGIKELLDAIGTSNLGYLLDIYHWDTAGQVFEDFRKIPGSEWVVMVHINDAPKGLALEEQIDLKRELPGTTGVLRIEEFMRGLLNLNFDGPVIVEPFNESLAALPFEDAVRMAKASMDKVWPK